MTALPRQAALVQPYIPPEWVRNKCIKNIPKTRIRLGNFPTPLQDWSFKVKGKQFDLLIKRDDLSDMTASGNKVRKLEFIFPQILEESYDWVISVGGTQSNHCRAVSAIAARLGIPSAHVLRKDSNYDPNRPTEGNLLLHSLFSSKIYLVTKEEYVTKGQFQLLLETREKVMKEHGAVKPFLLPVGGSTIAGIFGYIEFIEELDSQIREMTKTDPEFKLDEIFFSCGSGGTAAGLAIGKYLCDSENLKNVILTGYTACDSPIYFHGHINQMLQLVGLQDETGQGVRSENLVNLVQSKGLGYAINTEEDLCVIKEIASTSGVILDPSYTGKALRQFINEERPTGRRSLFIHTGGIFSVFGQSTAFANLK
eukprot:TRINITY_DN2863_c0_g1_i2.p1 TRINITY_DN2863_c0_g1~~TRINITY_DN2863_c0_g1_i2.p1  ORF type:complete len:393 (+),score=75.86 TRINITY_DN2863_c0_g1_i2:78-1181(+)